MSEQETKCFFQFAHVKALPWLNLLESFIPDQLTNWCLWKESQSLKFLNSVPEYFYEPSSSLHNKSYLVITRNGHRIAMSCLFFLPLKNSVTQTVCLFGGMGEGWQISSVQIKVVFLLINRQIFVWSKSCPCQKLIKHDFFSLAFGCCRIFFFKIFQLPNPPPPENKQSLSRPPITM